MEENKELQKVYDWINKPGPLEHELKLDLEATLKLMGCYALFMSIVLVLLLGIPFTIGTMQEWSKSSPAEASMQLEQPSDR